MPRRIPRFDIALASQARAATEIVTAGEIAHASGSPAIRREWTIARLEALHELAYVRVFAAWESFLEAVFFRYLCGYASSVGQETLVSGRYFPSIAAAEQDVLGPRRTYLLWHSPQQVIDRCQKYIRSGSPAYPARQETVIASSVARLDALAATRHRIVHEQTDARNKFDNATLLFVGRTYPASRPGRFLREWNHSTMPRQRWLETTISELTALASQMV